jgi:transketolase
VLADSKPGETPELILMGTGSEVSLCVEAFERLAGEGVRVRVVSMPCWELFDQQDQAYRDSVLPPGVSARIAVETGVEQGWQKYLGPSGRFIGMTTYGLSAPAKDLMKHFGFTADRVVATAKELLGRK